MQPIHILIDDSLIRIFTTAMCDVHTCITFHVFCLNALNICVWCYCKPEIKKERKL